MSPKEYMLAPLKRYAEFSGRADRPEYWYFYLLGVLINIPLRILGAILGSSPLALLPELLALGVGLGFIIPSLAVSFRRLHDTGRSGWWLLLALIPILGWIALLVFLIQPGAKGSNRYGDDPKQPLGELAAVF